MSEKNQFNFLALRRLGGEELRYTATINSDKSSLSEKEMDEQLGFIDKLFTKAFVQVSERTLKDSDVDKKFNNIRKEKELVNRTENTDYIKRNTQSLQEELMAKSKAELTLKEAQRVSDRINSINSKTN